MAEGGLQLTAGGIELSELLGREGIEIVAVGAHEMREYRARDDGVLMLQTVDQEGDFGVLGVLRIIRAIGDIKSQTMHASIKLDMHGPAGDTFLARCLDEGVEQTETVDLGLEVVVEHGLKGGHLGIHDHDIGGDAGLAEGDTLVGHRHSEIVDMVILQCLGNLHRTCTIAVGLNHAHHLRLGLQERTVIVQVLHHGIEIHLKDCLMHLLFQLLRNLVEAETTGTLQQNQFVAKTRKDLAGEDIIAEPSL